MPSLPFHSGLSCVLFHNLLLTVLDYKSLVVLAHLLTSDVVSVSLSVSVAKIFAIFFRSEVKFTEMFTNCPNK